MTWQPWMMTVCTENLDDTISTVWAMKSLGIAQEMKSAADSVGILPLPAIQLDSEQVLVVEKADS